MKKILLILLVANFAVIFGGILKNTDYKETFVVEAVDCPGGSIDACTGICQSGCGGSSDPAACSGGCYNACVDICNGGSGNNCGNGVCDAPGETATNCSDDCGGGSSDGGDDGSDDGGSDDGGSDGGGSTVSDCHDNNSCKTTGQPCTPGGDIECLSGQCCSNGHICSKAGGNCSFSQQELQDYAEQNNNSTGGVDQEEDEEDDTTVPEDALAYTSNLGGEGGSTNCSYRCSTFANTVVEDSCTDGDASVYLSTVTVTASSQTVLCGIRANNQNDTIRLNCSDGSTTESTSDKAFCQSDDGNEEAAESEDPINVPVDPDQCTQQQLDNIQNGIDGYFTLAANIQFDDSLHIICNKTADVKIYRCNSGVDTHRYDNSQAEYTCNPESTDTSSGGDEEEEEEQTSTCNQNQITNLSTRTEDHECTTSSGIDGASEVCSFQNGSSTTTFYCCPDNQVVSSVDGECKDSQSFNLNNSVKGLNIIKKAHAQSTPDTINPNQLDSGEYVIDPVGYESAEFQIYNDETRVRYFEDTNGNGVRNAGEPFLDTDAITINITRTKEIRKYKLVTGWNLIGFSFVNENISKASELVGTLARQGIITIQVAKYDSGNWINFVARVKANGELQTYGTDFNFVPGEGYFIRVKNGGEGILRGNLFTESVPMTLKRGWNLRSVQSVTRYTATSFLQNCNSNNIACKTISKFVNGLYESVTKNGEDFFGENFGLKKSEGYFILNKGPRGQFTP